MPSPSEIDIAIIVRTLAKWGAWDFLHIWFLALFSIGMVMVANIITNHTPFCDVDIDSTGNADWMSIFMTFPGLIIYMYACGISLRLNSVDYNRTANCCGVTFMEACSFLKFYCVLILYDMESDFQLCITYRGSLTDKDVLLILLGTEVISLVVVAVFIETMVAAEGGLFFGADGIPDESGDVRFGAPPKLGVSWNIDKDVSKRRSQREAQREAERERSVALARQQEAEVERESGARSWEPPQVQVHRSQSNSQRDSGRVRDDLERHDITEIKNEDSDDEYKAEAFM